MEHTHENTPLQALPGLWREAGGLAGMVGVAKQGGPWREQPELRGQVWPDLLVPDAA